MRNFPEEYKRTIAERYRDGESANDIRKTNPHHAGLILDWVREFGFEVRDRGTATRMKIQAPRAYIDLLSGEKIKLCTKCNKVLPIGVFRKTARNSTDGVAGNCNLCRNETRRDNYPNEQEKLKQRQKDNRKNHPNRYRQYDIKKRFRLDKQAYDALFFSQGNACGGCGFLDSGEPSGSWHIDHDHNCCSNPHGKTCGKCVRGILCRWCNMALGNAKEDASRLRGVANYIERFS